MDQAGGRRGGWNELGERDPQTYTPTCETDSGKHWIAQGLSPVPHDEPERVGVGAGSRLKGEGTMYTYG